MDQIRAMQRHHHRVRTMDKGTIEILVQKAVENFSGDGWIQTGKRLIGENQRRALPEQSGQSDPLSLTTREPLHRTIQTFGTQNPRIQSSLTQALQTGLCPDGEQKIRQCPGKPVPTQGAGVDVLANTEFLNQAQVLPEGADLTALTAVALTKTLATPENASLLRDQRAIDHRHQ